MVVGRVVLGKRGLAGYEKWASETIRGRPQSEMDVCLHKLLIWQHMALMRTHA